MGLLDRFRGSDDGYGDVEKGRAEEVDIEDWQTEYNMRTYYNNQEPRFWPIEDAVKSLNSERFDKVHNNHSFKSINSGQGDI